MMFESSHDPSPEPGRTWAVLAHSLAEPNQDSASKDMPALLGGSQSTGQRFREAAGGGGGAAERRLRQLVWTKPEPEAPAGPRIPILSPRQPVRGRGSPLSFNPNYVFQG
jgi:hypothetical protein